MGMDRLTYVISKNKLNVLECALSLLTIVINVKI